jgi:hypothetical protein
MIQSDELRRQAILAGERADATRSLTEAVRERRRQKAFDQLAETADWLDGQRPEQSSAEHP